MAGLMSLANHLLIASPSLNDPMFSHSLIYVCEHHPEGTVGLIINRPTPFSMSLVFDQLHIRGVSPETQQLPLLLGGLFSLNVALWFIVLKVDGSLV